MAVTKFFLAAPDAFEHDGEIIGESLDALNSRPIDILDQLLEFSYHLPAWLDPDKMPLTWAHFVYGMDYLRRMKSRAILASADASRMGQVEQQDYVSWRRVHESVARF